VRILTPFTRVIPGTPATHVDEEPVAAPPTATRIKGA